MSSSFSDSIIFCINLAWQSNVDWDITSYMCISGFLKLAPQLNKQMNEQVTIFCFSRGILLRLDHNIQEPKQYIQESKQLLAVACTYLIQEEIEKDKCTEEKIHHSTNDWLL